MSRVRHLAPSALCRTDALCPSPGAIYSRLPTSQLTAEQAGVCVLSGAAELGVRWITVREL